MHAYIRGWYMFSTTVPLDIYIFFLLISYIYIFFLIFFFLLNLNLIFLSSSYLSSYLLSLSFLISLLYIYIMYCNRVFAKRYENRVIDWLNKKNTWYPTKKFFLLMLIIKAKLILSFFILTQTFYFTSILTFLIFLFFVCLI